MARPVFESRSVGEATMIKNCCANLYEHQWTQLLLGESFHPGGLQLTERVGELLNLKPGDCVLDIASGQGTSAIFLAQKFGCEVVGVDYGVQAVAGATKLARQAGVQDLVYFEQGDAERLRFADETFDALICECAFCTFPDKTRAANEFARVLRPGGKIGLSDLTRSGSLPQELNGLLAWIACIADARSADEYVSYLLQAGLESVQVESHNAALSSLVQEVRTKLLGIELLVRLQKLDFPEDSDFDQAKIIARHAARAVERGKLGYAIFTGKTPS